MLLIYIYIEQDLFFLIEIILMYILMKDLPQVWVALLVLLLASGPVLRMTTWGDRRSVGVSDADGG